VGVAGGDFFEQAAANNIPMINVLVFIRVLRGCKWRDSKRLTTPGNCARPPQQAT